MLWLVDPTNVADAATADERTCVERISPVEGEGFELSVPSDRGWSRSGSRPKSFSKKTDGPNVSRFVRDSRPKDFISHPAESMAQRDRHGT